MSDAKKESKPTTVKDVKKELADQSKKNRANGGKDVVVSITDTVEVRFTKDFGKHIKKGHTQRMSILSYKVYDKNGVVEKIG